MANTPSIPLDEHGLPSHRLELPEGFIDELNNAWSDFVAKEAMEQASVKVPEASQPMPELPTDDFKSLWQDNWEDNHKKGASHFGSLFWNGIMSVIAVTLIAVLGIKGVSGNDVLTLYLSISLFLNLGWFSMWKTAASKKAKWWTTIPIYAAIVALIVQTDFGRAFDDYWPVVFWVDILMMLMMTPLPWLWVKDPFKKKLAEVVSAREKLRAAQAVRDTLALELRESVEDNPTVLLKFLDANSGTLWTQHEGAWKARTDEIKDGIAQGEIMLRSVREYEQDPALLQMKQEAISDTITALKSERDAITRAGDNLAASKQALGHLGNRLRGSFRRIEEDKKLEAWLIRQKCDQAAARLALERAQLEIQITLRWFLSQLGDQHARLEAKRVLELPGVTSPKSAQLTPEQHREAAHLEVARTLVGGGK